MCNVDRHAAPTVCGAIGNRLLAIDGASACGFAGGAGGGGAVVLWAVVLPPGRAVNFTR